MASLTEFVDFSLSKILFFDGRERHFGIGLGVWHKVDIISMTNHPKTYSKLLLSSFIISLVGRDIGRVSSSVCKWYIFLLYDWRLHG